MRTPRSHSCSPSNYARRTAELAEQHAAEVTEQFVLKQQKLLRRERYTAVCAPLFRSVDLNVSTFQRNSSAARSPGPGPSADLFQHSLFRGVDEEGITTIYFQEGQVSSTVECGKHNQNLKQAECGEQQSEKSSF